VFALLSLLFCSTVPDSVDDYSVSVIELNHVVSFTEHSDGSTVASVHLSQLIFWQLHADGEFYVRDWRMLKDAKPPRYDHDNRVWRASWLDRSLQAVRVTAPAYLETYSIHDPEVENRALFPMNQRKQFRR